MEDIFNNIIVRISAGKINDLSADEIAELRRVARDCPASPLAPAILLKYADQTLTEADRADFRARVALSGGSQRELINFIDPEGLALAQFYPPVPELEAPSTANAIDTFLETYGHRTPEEDALLEHMIFNPVPDYAESLARDEAPTTRPEAPQGSQDQLIDAFLAANPPAETPAKPEPAPAPAPVPSKPKPKSKPAAASAPMPEDSLLSESLAKIFIKQGRYERAYEIITNLSLNYPKKSVYFADQLRFLRKLIINQRYAQRNGND